MHARVLRVRGWAKWWRKVALSQSLAAGLLWQLSVLPLAGAPKRPVKPGASAPAAASPAPLDEAQQLAMAEHWMRGMTLRQKAAQLVIVRAYGDLPADNSQAMRDFLRWTRRDGIGGIIVINRVGKNGVINAEPVEMATFLNKMQSASKLPLLVGGDFERGASMRVAGTVKYPHLMAFGATGNPENSFFLGRETAREARALGVHWVYGPVADVNVNPVNPILGIRTFGEEPTLVAEHVQAFIRGAHSDPQNPVILCAKHFPGHGDTAVDSHYGLPVLDIDKERLEKVEFPPFQAAIAAGIDSVMTAHIALPKVDPENVPSTISRTVVTNLLRDRLGFRGLITTDALDMAGISAQYKPGEAAVRALEAGVDVLLIPADVDQAITGVVQAVKQKRISMERLDASVRKLLATKAKLGLHRQRLVNTKELPQKLLAKESVERAQQIAEAALYLHKDPKGMWPMKPGPGNCLVLLPERAGNTQGWAFLEELQKQQFAGNIRMLEPNLEPAVMEAQAQELRACGALTIAAFAQLGGYRGNAPLPGNYPAFLQAVQGLGVPVALVSLGSPYLYGHFPRVEAYLTTYSPAPTSETAAARAVLGLITAKGRKNATLPQ